MTRFCRMHNHYIIMYDMETDILNSLAVGCLLSHSCLVLSTVVTEQVLFEVHKVEAAWVSIFLLQTYSTTSYNHGFYSNLFGQDVTAASLRSWQTRIRRITLRIRRRRKILVECKIYQHTTAVCVKIMPMQRKDSATQSTKSGNTVKFLH